MPEVCEALQVAKRPEKYSVLWDKVFCAFYGLMHSHNWKWNWQLATQVIAAPENETILPFKPTCLTAFLGGKISSNVMLFPQTQTFQTPGAYRVTLLLHLRITPHSPRLPWMATALPGLPPHKRKRTGESDHLQLWRNITTTCVCTQACRTRTVPKH